MALHFARSDRDRSTDARFSYQRSRRGVPYLAGALAHFDCQVEGTHDYGDHTVFVARVHEAGARQGMPLLFFESRLSSLEPSGTAR